MDEPTSFPIDAPLYSKRKGPVRVKNIVASLFTLLLLGGALVVGLIAVKERQEQRGKAASTGIKLLFNGVPASASPGATFTANLLVTVPSGSTHKISAVDATIKYPSSKLTLVSVTPGTFFTVPIAAEFVGKTESLNKITTTTAGAAKIILGAACVNTNVVTDQTKWKCFPATLPNQLAQLKFKVNAGVSGDASISVDPTDTALTVVGQTSNMVDSALPTATLAITGSTDTTPTPTTTTGVVPGDINRDRVVNSLDYAVLFENFGKQPLLDPRADIAPIGSPDGKVNSLDYSILFETFGKKQ